MVGIIGYGEVDGDDYFEEGDYDCEEMLVCEGEVVGFVGCSCYQ